MNSLDQSLFFVGAASLAVLALAVAILHNQLRQYIELSHQAVWERFGSPRFSGGNPLTRMRFAGFVLSGGYRQFGDAKLNKLADRVRVACFAEIMLFFSILFLFFWR